MKKIVIVGSPNVGKSALFGALTGRYAAVSNYPGTTVELTRGAVKIGKEEFEIIDTPGMYSFLPVSEEERVARAILLSETPAVVLHVIDAKNIEHALSLTLQLREARLPCILVLNMFDELRSAGSHIDIARLEKELAMPVVATVAPTGEGIAILKGRIEGYVNVSPADRV
jgi:ferrous iron transport protein B